MIFWIVITRGKKGDSDSHPSFKAKGAVGARPREGPEDFILGWSSELFRRSEKLQIMKFQFRPTEQEPPAVAPRRLYF